MPQIVGQGAAIQLDGFYADGTSAAVDAVTPRVSIIDPSNNVVVNLATPTHISLGHYQYTYNVAINATLGAWAARWFGLVNGVQVGPIDDGFTVTLAGSIVFENGSGGSCQQWCDAGSVSACCSATLAPDVMSESIAIATDILYRLSGQKYPGVCSDVVRPINDGLIGICGDKYLRDAIIQGKLTSYDYRGCGLHGFFGCGCTNFQQVRLGGLPIGSITQVKVDGAVLDPAKYTVLDREWLVRTDDGSWPCCQDVRKPNTAVDTFEVSYTYGMAPPVSGVKAAAKLACEIAKACVNDETCELPERITSLTRQGVSMAVLDPQTFLDHGRTGIYLVDLFLKAHNPDGESAHGAMVQSPDYDRRVRRRG